MTEFRLQLHVRQKISNCTLLLTAVTCNCSRNCELNDASELLYAGAALGDGE